MNAHPTKRLRTPAGSRANIDAELVPLIKALWGAGFETIGCCQDTGECLSDYPRMSAYYSGYALLEMPVDDGLALLDILRRTSQFGDRMHWALPGAWSMSIPVAAYMSDPDDDEATVSDMIQMRFPKDQVGDLVEVITSLVPLS
jgi:hypothetical protein